MAEPSSKQAMRREVQTHMTFGQMQQLVLTLPKAMDKLQEQTKQIEKDIKQELAIIQAQTKLSEQSISLLELVHDRLDALAIESRVTNVLLAELVAIHQTMITDDTEPLQEIIRHQAYTKVLSAQ